MEEGSHEILEKKNVQMVTGRGIGFYVGEIDGAGGEMGKCRQS